MDRQTTDSRDVQQGRGGQPGPRSQQTEGPPADPDETSRAGERSTADIAAAVEARQAERTDGSRAPANVAAERRAQGGMNGHVALFGDDEARTLRESWDEIQASFVDEPRASVKDADALVADVMHRLAQSFARERESLEGQWGRGDDVSTEELRLALRRYRSFFDRLLSV